MLFIAAHAHISWATGLFDAETALNRVIFGRKPLLERPVTKPISSPPRSANSVSRPRVRRRFEDAAAEVLQLQFIALHAG
jgi:hypothetical protein